MLFPVIIEPEAYYGLTEEDKERLRSTIEDLGGELQITEIHIGDPAPPAVDQELTTSPTDST